MKGRHLNNTVKGSKLAGRSFVDQSEVFDMPTLSLRETDAVLKRGLKNGILASCDLADIFRAVYDFIIDKFAQKVGCGIRVSSLSKLRPLQCTARSVNRPVS